MSSAARVPRAPRDLPFALRRYLQLMLGLVVFAISMACMVRANLGVMPWDVLHQGLSHYVGLSFGTITIIVGALVLLAWIPIRQRPGIGTVANVIVIGLVVDQALAVIPQATTWPSRIALLLTGVVVNSIATAAYIGAGLGPGPRDGLMTGLVARTGGSIRLVRTGIEVMVVTTGFLLGGTVGIGTLIFAIGVGPIIQLFMPWFQLRDLPQVGALGPVQA